MIENLGAGRNGEGRVDGFLDGIALSFFFERGVGGLVFSIPDIFLCFLFCFFLLSLERLH